MVGETESGLGSAGAVMSGIREKGFLIRVEESMIEFTRHNMYFITNVREKYLSCYRQKHLGIGDEAEFGRRFGSERR